MSLNFSFANVRDHEAVTTNPSDPERWHPVADALVWLSLICGYSSITEKNCDKVASRIMAYQQGVGAYLRFGVNGTKGVYITKADVQRFVGMTTNATAMTDAQWAKHLANCVTRESQYIKQDKSALDIANDIATEIAAKAKEKA